MLKIFNELRKERTKVNSNITLSQFHIINIEMKTFTKFITTNLEHYNAYRSNFRWFIKSRKAVDPLDQIFSLTTSHVILIYVIHKIWKRCNQMYRYTPEFESRDFES